ncbi:MAG: redoxin domain-containing protein [Candidatus Hydrogenedentes bacterium]|nr:redoxin domain-containing protein [Candidatus Hydrogenedentota bacterium]
MTHFFSVRQVSTALALGVLFLSGITSGQSPGDSKAKASAALSNAAERLAGEESFALKATVTYKGSMKAEVETIVTDFTVAFERPDAISVHTINSDLEILFVSDGQHYIRYVPEFKQYVDSAEEMAAAEVIATSGFEMIAPALELLSEVAKAAPFSSVLEASDLEYMGVETWNNIECDRIRFTMGYTQYDVWIQRGDDALIRKIVPSMAALEEQLGLTAGIMYRIEVAAEITEWELGIEVAERVVFNPPDDAVKVAAFHAPTPAEALKGKMAPDFTVALLDGSSFTLSEHKGEIVILDFWATWCGPCRVAMPVLSDVAKEFADEGVRLYGVNLREEPERIRAYLKGQGLDVTVALDSDGRVGEMYKASGIPQTVIVGRDGKVAIVHVGLWAMPTMAAASELTREEESKLIYDMLAEALRKELRELISAETATEG